jgi:(E)-4-hydroxy-3-methylbut-2-enyl-diphosphate synthase
MQVQPRKDHVQDHAAVRPWRAIQGRKNRPIRMGKVAVGGDAPISVQPMTNRLTADAAAEAPQALERQHVEA